MLFIVVLWFVSVVRSAPTGCELNPFGTKTPILLQPGTVIPIYPANGDVTLGFSTKSKVEFTCPGEQLTANGASLGPSVIGTCERGDVFNINGQSISWSKLSCNQRLKADIKELLIENLNEDNPNIKCYDADKKSLKIYQIGFKIDQNRFLPTIDICFNTVTKISVYSYYNLSASISNRAKKVNSISFKQDDAIYNMGISIRQTYQNNQTTINKIVGLPESSEKYVNKVSFINRGHLAAKADFMYGSFQEATYRYVNAAPQWSSFNGGNWNQAETDVRNFADRNNLNLQIWTGTYGITNLAYESTNVPIDLYLYVWPPDKKNSPAFPIPEVFWKIVFDPISKKGILLVGHNNPYETIPDKNQKICDTDVTSRVSWLNWRRNDVTRGFSYACNCNDSKFLKLVPYVPKLTVNGLLLDSSL